VGYRSPPWSSTQVFRASLILGTFLGTRLSPWSLCTHTFVYKVWILPRINQKFIFFRRRNNQLVFQNILLQGVDIPRTDSVRFLEVILDEKLNGKAQRNSLITKGTKIAKIILSLSGGVLTRLSFSHCTVQFSEALSNTALKFLVWSVTRVFGPEFNKYNTVSFEQPWICINPLLSVCCWVKHVSLPSSWSLNYSFPDTFTKAYPDDLAYLLDFFAGWKSPLFSLQAPNVFTFWETSLLSRRLYYKNIF